MPVQFTEAESMPRVSYLAVAGIIVVIILLCLGGGTLPFLLFDSMESRGQFGDMFGAVNSLFSALAFAGVLLAIILQRQELQLQRQELLLSRQELKRAAQAQEKSQEALAAQLEVQSLATQLQALAALLSYRSTWAQQNEMLDQILLQTERHAEVYALRIEMLLARLQAKAAPASDPQPPPPD